MGQVLTSAEMADRVSKTISGAEMAERVSRILTRDEMADKISAVRPIGEGTIWTTTSSGT